MISSLFVGIGCGLASAFLFYSGTRGLDLLTFALLLLTPLPIAIAGLAWNWVTAVVAGVTGALVLGFVAGPSFATGCFLALGAPAAMLAYLTDLGRDRADGTVDWFPAGYILAALTLYAGLFPLLIAPMFGGTYAILRPDFARFVTQFSQRMGQALSDEQVQAWATILVEVVPASIAAYFLLIWALNSYLGGRVARASGRLSRPWPDLHRLAFPSGMAFLFGATILASAASGTPRIIGTAMSGALLVGYALLGLSVVHCISKGRVPWPVWLTYALIFTPLAPYVLIALALVGLGEPVLRIRERFTPAPPPSSV